MLRKLTGGISKRSAKTPTDQAVPSTTFLPSFAPNNNNNNKSNSNNNSNYYYSNELPNHGSQMYKPSPQVPLQKVYTSNDKLPDRYVAGDSIPMSKSHTTPSLLMASKNQQLLAPNMPIQPSAISNSNNGSNSTIISTAYANRSQPNLTVQHEINNSIKKNTPSHIVTPNFQYPKRAPPPLTPLNTAHQPHSSSSRKKSQRAQNERSARSAPGTPVQQFHPAFQGSRVDYSHSSKASLSSLADLEESLNNIIDAHRKEPVPAIPAHIIAKLEQLNDNNNSAASLPIMNDHRPRNPHGALTINTDDRSLQHSHSVNGATQPSTSPYLPTASPGGKWLRHRQQTPSFIAPPPPSESPPVHLRNSVISSRASTLAANGNGIRQSSNIYSFSAVAPLSSNTPVITRSMADSSASMSPRSPNMSNNTASHHIGSQLQASVSVTTLRPISELSMDDKAKEHNNRRPNTTLRANDGLKLTVPGLTLSNQDTNRVQSLHDADYIDYPDVTQQLIARMMTDTQSYKPLSAGEFNKLSDELSMLQARLSILRDAHAKEVRILDCAVSLLQLHRGGKNKRAERKAMDELQIAYEKVSKVLLDLWRLSLRMAEVRSQMNDHQSAVLRVGMSRLDATNRRLLTARDRKRRTIVSSVLFSETDMALIDSMKEKNANMNEHLQVDKDKADKNAQALLEAEARIRELEEALVETNEDLERAREETESAKRACETEASTAASARYQLQEVGRLLALIAPNAVLDDNEHHHGSLNDATHRISATSTGSNIILSRLEHVHDEVEDYRHRIRQLEEELIKQSQAAIDSEFADTSHLEEDERDYNTSNDKPYDLAAVDTIAEIRQASEDELNSLRQQLEARSVEVSDLREQLEEACCDVRDLELCQESIVTPLQDMFSVLPPAPSTIADDDTSCTFTFPGFLARVEALRYKYTVLAKDSSVRQLDDRLSTSRNSAQSSSSQHLSYISGAMSSTRDSTYNDSEMDASMHAISSASLSRIQVIASPLKHNKPMDFTPQYPSILKGAEHLQSQRHEIKTAERIASGGKNGQNELGEHRTSDGSTSSLTQIGQSYDMTREDSDYSNDAAQLMTPMSYSASSSVPVMPKKQPYEAHDHDQLARLSPSLQPWPMVDPKHAMMYNHSSGLDRLLDQLDSITPHEQQQS
ncbi:hypothetical protein BDF19DRAFT_410937 [Syncephalis fuscata]|nr:hypothetical protein BDF19DRAFT_410937 [Syncephalis fuscata]